MSIYFDNSITPFAVTYYVLSVSAFVIVDKEAWLLTITSDLSN